MNADLGRAAEIRYGKIPDLQIKLEVKLARLKKLQKSRRILKEEITTEDIAEVVSRWTGIPLLKMLEEERARIVMINDDESENDVIANSEFIPEYIVGQQVMMLEMRRGWLSEAPHDSNDDVIHDLGPDTIRRIKEFFGEPEA